MSKARVVVVGGGFGGIQVAKGLAKPDVHVTVIDRANHFLFQPLLYQVATAGLSPADIATPIRSILRGQKNAEVLLGEVVGVDRDAKRVTLADGGEVDFDYLVLATGARHGYFGNDDWEPLAPGLKTLDDATWLRRNILLAFERAERALTPESRAEEMTFVIVGAGATGVEMAGSIAELARRALVCDFDHIRPELARVVLVEAGPRVLAAYAEDLSAKALRSLESLGVEVKLNSKVTSVDPSGVTLSVGDESVLIRTRNVIWAAGVQATPVARWLGAESDRAGRVIVEPDLSVPGSPDIFVIGDAMAIRGYPLPGVAQVAMQQGRFVARLIRERVGRLPSPAPSETTNADSLRGGGEGWGRGQGGEQATAESPDAGKVPAVRGEVFRYRDLGNMATIGRSSAIFERGRWKMSGFIAWMGWLFIHLMQLVGHRNRLSVFLQWMWAYIFWDRGARLITPVGKD